MAYESNLSLTFGPAEPAPQASWEFEWQAAGAPPAGVPAGLAAATQAVTRDILADDQARTRFPAPAWGFRSTDGALAVLDLANVTTMPVLAAGQLTAAELTAAELTALIADIVQDQLTGYEFVQWPLCPGHRHPMRASAAAGDAWWTCPAESRPVCRIGHLAETADHTA